MIWFSRSFIRKRVISLAATTSVGAISLALSHVPTRAHYTEAMVPIQYVAYQPRISREPAGAVLKYGQNPPLRRLAQQLAHAAHASAH